MAKRWIFTYRFCNDLGAMKRFYGGVLQLDQIWEDESSIAYKIGDHQLSFTLDASLPKAEAEYAFQPGWQEGKAHTTSWSMACDKQDFLEIVEAANQQGLKSYFGAPRWVGYWSFPLLDPMNATVEITCEEQDLGL